MKEARMRYEALLSGTTADELRALADAPAMAFGRQPGESVVLMNCALHAKKDKLVILSGAFLTKGEEFILRAAEICWSRKAVTLRQPTVAEVQAARELSVRFERVSDAEYVELVRALAGGIEGEALGQVLH
jgi:hypothetical protein